MKEEIGHQNPIQERLKILRWRLRWLNPFACKKGMRWTYFKLFFSSYLTPTPKIKGESSWTEDDDAYMDASLFMDEEDLQ